MLTKPEKKRLKKLQGIYEKKCGNITLQQRVEIGQLMEKKKPFVERKEKVLLAWYCVIGVLIVLGSLGFYLYDRNFTTASICFCFGAFGLYIISNTLGKISW